MADIDKKERYHYLFVHNLLGKFFEELLDFISTNWYERFSTKGSKVIGTYAKTVQLLEDAARLGREQDQPNLPIITLNPSGDFLPSEDGGKFFWRYPNLEPGINLRLNEPIYEDGNVRIVVGFGRYYGEIELIMWLNSVYEFLDVRLLFIQLFGGLERYIYPFWFDSFIVLPSELYFYQYSNSVTGKSYTLDWAGTGATSTLILSTNRQEYVYPVSTKPRFKLTSISDGSTKYGGPDKISEWRLNLSIVYDLEIPTYLILQTDYLVETIKAEIASSAIITETEEISAPDSYTTQLIDKTGVTQEQTFIFYKRYYHTISSSDMTSNQNYIVISLPELVDSQTMALRVFGKWGELAPYDHYIFSQDQTKLLLSKQYVSLKEGDVLILIYYTKEGS